MPSVFLIRTESAICILYIGLPMPAIRKKGRQKRDSFSLR